MLPTFITKLGHFSLVLGIPWLQRHAVVTDFVSNSVRFQCPSHQNPPAAPQVALQTIGMVPKTTNMATETPKGTTTPRQSVAPKPLDVASNLKSKSPAICVISSPSLTKVIRRKELVQIFAMSLYDINKALETPTQNPQDTEQAEPPDYKRLKSLIPSKYHSFLPLFCKSVPNKLPPYCPYDHRIPLKEGFEPPLGPLYSLAHLELEACKQWIEENLNKGFIWASSSLAGAPILFLKKGDGSFRLVVDYRGINEGTVKNRYPLPLIRETLIRISKAWFFTKLDVRGAYNLIRMAEGGEWKTTFQTCYRLYKSLVMPFGLTNAPADFQRFINETLAPFLDHFTSVYLDDILIYSHTMEEHTRHVHRVLERLTDAGLHLKPEKCEFHKTEVNYLGLIIGADGIKMDPSKVETVKVWPPPRNLRDVPAFLGFANFYRRFVKGCSKVVELLTRLTRKGQPLKWETKQQESFDRLKTSFTTAPILRRFDHDRDIVVKTDASDFVSAAVLSLYDDQGTLHPVAYFSKKHSPAECNYEIYDKELMAIVRVFEEWRAELQSVENPISVLMDNKNLEYFMTTKLLNHRQARWAQFLSQFNFKIVY